jgi:hypothetical protein
VEESLFTILQYAQYLQQLIFEDGKEREQMCIQAKRGDDRIDKNLGGPDNHVVHCKTEGGNHPKEP